MNAIVINYEPFAMNSQLYVVKEGKNEQHTIHSSLSDLAQSAVNLAAANNIYEVKIFLPNDFMLEFKKEVEQAEILTYGCNKINIETYN